MLYAQRLFESGNDLQAAFVARRNAATGNLSSSRSSALLKYHAFVGASEVDVLFGQHYDEPVFGLGTTGQRQDSSSTAACPGWHLAGT